MDENTIIPKASLWVGIRSIVENEIIHYLQQLYCHSACKVCNICRSIQNKQFHALHFASPSSHHTIEDFSAIEQIVSYSRNEQEPFFFVIPHADFLSQACANKLLKVLEGSENSYFFILSATHLSHVIPTIVSRCFIKQCTGVDNSENLLLNLFTKETVPSLSEFNQLLETYRQKPDFEIRADCNRLFSFWSEKYLSCQNDTEKKYLLSRVLACKQLVTHNIPAGSFPLVARSLYANWILF